MIMGWSVFVPGLFSLQVGRPPHNNRCSSTRDTYLVIVVVTFNSDRVYLSMSDVCGTYVVLGDLLEFDGHKGTRAEFL